MICYLHLSVLDMKRYLFFPRGLTWLGDLCLLVRAVNSIESGINITQFNLSTGVINQSITVGWVREKSFHHCTRPNLNDWKPDLWRKGAGGRRHWALVCWCVSATSGRCAHALFFQIISSYPSFLETDPAKTLKQKLRTAITQLNLAIVSSRLHGDNSSPRPEFNLPTTCW